MPHPDAGRFLTVPQIAEELATSEVQVVSMLRRGDIRAIKLGGRGQWRIERAELEAYIQRAYEETQREMQARREALDGDSADLDYRQEEGGEG